MQTLFLVGAEGFEPPTLCLSGRRSEPAELSALSSERLRKGKAFFRGGQIFGEFFSRNFAGEAYLLMLLTLALSVLRLVNLPDTLTSIRELPRAIA